MKNVVTRSISGLVYIALIVGSLLAGAHAFYALTLLFAVVGVIEFHRLEDRNLSGGTTVWVVRLLDVAGAVAVTSLIACAGEGYHPSGIWAMSVALWSVARVVTALYDRGADAFRSVAVSVMALWYIAAPMGVLNILYSRELAGNSQWIFTLLVFIMIWLNDTGAFCVGSLFGRHRLCERLSPKKSWEGFFGGLLFCVLFSIVVSMSLVSALSAIEWIGLGVVVSVFSTWGDLFESLMKRTLGVKDSGNIIPGHGGILDRIDSLLLVAPAVLFYLYLIG